MDSNEQYVREKWERVSCYDVKPGIHMAGLHIGAGEKPCIHHFGERESLAEAWQAAADFTRAHEKKISDVEEEIRYLQITADEFNRNERDWETWGRILAARQAALTELRKGWKG